MPKLFARRLVASLLLILFSQGPVMPQTKTTEGDRQRFIGTWRLVTDENIKDGKVTYPDFGPRGVGYLIYSPDGHMCVGLMNPDRPKWKQPRDASDKEKILLFDSFYAYCGTYEIREAEHLMIHRPELASTPDYVDSVQPRPYTFDGDRVSFSGPETSPRGGTFHIVWEKAK